MTDPRRAPLADRLARRTDKRGPDECWEWLGADRGLGYGIISDKAGNSKHRNKLVHREAYRLHYGDIPAGLFVCHSCDNRRCVNPAHLFLGTAQDNMTDKKLKGRAVAFNGERNPRSKLTNEQVAEILTSPLRGAEMARRLGVGQSIISAIRLGQKWKHIPRSTEAEAV